MAAPPRDGPPPEVHVFEPHRAGLPPLRPYVKGIWARRHFIYQMSRTSLRAQHFDTFFGQLWVVLNPLLLAMVYFFLVSVLRGGEHPRGTASFLAYLVGGLFLFYFVRNSIGQGAGSIVGGGGLLMNTAFPRAILPLSSTVTALMLYIPTLVVYGAFHIAAGEPISPALLLLPLLFGLLMVFNLGLAMAAGALTVYFRDTSSMLPYLLRIWLYLSPILWTIDQAPEVMQDLIFVNPLAPFLTAWHVITLDGVAPSATLWLGCLGWTIASVAFGGWFFLSREREFAIRV